MANIVELENNIKKIIDELKGVCQTNGLTGSPKEESVITSIFLYKFLNDKFMWNLTNFSKKIHLNEEDVLNNKNGSLNAFYKANQQDVEFKKEDTITELAKFIGNKEFYKYFDNVLLNISSNPKNAKFSVKRSDGTVEPLFDKLSDGIEDAKKNSFSVSLFSCIAQSRFDFGEAFEENFDFYSTIFEYLIKDYNVASGVYAEYFTPQAVSKIIAKILVKMSPIEDTIYEIYDPSAGSGSLVLHLANELGNGSFGNKARVFAQDISQKSTRFLRINMLLNGLTASLDNIVRGDTLLSPAHYQKVGDASSGLKKFDFITSNPPFKMDFSSTRDTIESSYEGTDRFFAGIPKTPNKDKEKMAIYLLFIQHILYSLKDGGKAAIVVPTGFITAQAGIEKAIREKIIDKKWLKGVISMPSNIFANTGTNVSILFIDKTNNKDDSDVILIDASKLGKKEKVGKNQRTVLNKEETKKIEDTFINKEEVEGFSVLVKYEDIKNKNYSFSAGQYFDVKIEYIELSEEEFNSKILNYENELNEYFAESNKLQKEIIEQLGKVKYDN